MRNEATKKKRALWHVNKKKWPINEESWTELKKKKKTIPRYLDKTASKLTLLLLQQQQQQQKYPLQLIITQSCGENEHTD